MGTDISNAELFRLSDRHNIDISTVLELFQSFNSFDKNKDGFISHADLKSVIKMIGNEHIHIQDSEILELIKGVWIWRKCVSQDA